MTALATTEQLAARLGRDITADELARVTALLEDASAAVRSYTGQHFTSEERTARLRVTRGRVRLPQRPVTAVAAVADTNEVDVTFTWDAGDSVDLTANPLNAWELEGRTSPLRYVDVTYTAGYTDIPSDIVAVVCSIAGRSFGLDPQMGGITSESIGDASLSYGTIGAAGPLGLLPDERAVLDRYRRIGGTAMVG